jgi:hypothetical protein
MANDETMNPGECCCCKFETEDLHFVRKLSGGTYDHWHCNLCYSTRAGKVCGDGTVFAQISAHVNLVANLTRGDTSDKGQERKWHGNDSE